MDGIKCYLKSATSLWSLLDLERPEERMGKSSTSSLEF